MIDRSASIFLFSLIFFFFLQHHYWKGERATWCRRSHCLRWRVYLLRAAKNAKKKEKKRSRAKVFISFFIAHKERKKKRRADSWQNLIFFCWKTNFFFYIFTIVWQNGASKCNTRSGSKRPFLFFPYLFIQPFSHSWGCWQYQKDILFCSPPPSLPQYTFCQQTKQTRKEKIYISHYIYLFIDFYLSPEIRSCFITQRGTW